MSVLSRYGTYSAVCLNSTKVAPPAKNKIGFFSAHHGIRHKQLCVRACRLPQQSIPQSPTVRRVPDWHQLSVHHTSPLTVLCLPYPPRYCFLFPYPPPPINLSPPNLLHRALTAASQPSSRCTRPCGRETGTASWLLLPRPRLFPLRASSACSAGGLHHRAPKAEATTPGWREAGAVDPQPPMAACRALASFHFPLSSSRRLLVHCTLCVSQADWSA